MRRSVVPGKGLACLVAIGKAKDTRPVVRRQAQVGYAAQPVLTAGIYQELQQGVYNQLIMSQGSRERSAVFLLAVSTVILAAVVSLPCASAQSGISDWEKAAGGKMSFDVASVKPNTGGLLTQPSIPLDNSDVYPRNTTVFSASVPLVFYISFAYKLPAYERDGVTSQLPKWARTQRFDIQARAASPSTKDQMRLMTQSLLVDRFKLAVHWEKRRTPSFDLVLVKPGKTGPELQPHNDRIPCQPYTPNPSGYEDIPGQLPAFCGKLVGGGGPAGGSAGGRKITMAQFAEHESSLFDRPIIDKTGLTGTFDINLSFRFNLSPSEMQQFGLGDIQTGFIRAFRDQLGLKLEASTSSSDVLIIDHIDQLTPN